MNPPDGIVSAVLDRLRGLSAADGIEDRLAALGALHGDVELRAPLQVAPRAYHDGPRARLDDKPAVLVTIGDGSLADDEPDTLEDRYVLRQTVRVWLYAVGSDHAEVTAAIRRLFHAALESLAGDARFGDHWHRLPGTPGFRWSFSDVGTDRDRVSTAGVWIEFTVAGDETVDRSVAGRPPIATPSVTVHPEAD